MKQKLWYIAVIVLLLITIVLGNIFDDLAQNEKIQHMQISVYPADKTFIMRNEIAKLIPVKNKKRQEINIIELEQKLEQNAYIDNAEVYQDLNGTLTAQIEQYHPIARVLGEKSYYIDANGNSKPLSKHYTENTVLIYGKITPKNKKNILKLVKALHDDQIVKNMISEIHLSTNYVYLITDRLKPKIIIDIQDKTPEQLTKLKAIYAYLVKQKMEDKYTQIDLRYKKQAICK